jgi:hypothetical protein
MEAQIIDLFHQSEQSQMDLEFGNLEAMGTMASRQIRSGSGILESTEREASATFDLIRADHQQFVLVAERGQLELGETVNVHLFFQGGCTCYEFKAEILADFEAPEEWNSLSHRGYIIQTQDLSVSQMDIVLTTALHDFFN